MAVRVLSLPCADELLAESFAGWLRSKKVAVKGIDGRRVLVPTDNLAFAWDIADAVVEHEWAHDDEVVDAMNAFLEGAETR